MCRAFDCEDTNQPTHVSYTHVQMYMNVIGSRHNIRMTGKLQIIIISLMEEFSNDIIILKFDHFMNHLLRCINDYNFDDPLKGSSNLAA